MSESAPAERVLRVALTGGIATGKSACLRRFAELGFSLAITVLIYSAIVSWNLVNLIKL